MLSWDRERTRRTAISEQDPEKSHGIWTKREEQKQFSGPGKARRETRRRSRSTEQHPGCCVSERGSWTVSPKRLGPICGPNWFPAPLLSLFPGLMPCQNWCKTHGIQSNLCRKLEPKVMRSWTHIPKWMRWGRGWMI